MTKRSRFSFLFIIIISFCFYLIYNRVYTQNSDVDRLGRSLAKSITSRFNKLDNNSTFPDYYVNGVIVHGWDTWASYKPLSESIKQGLVASSYIRRDIAEVKKLPIYYSSNDGSAFGVILKPIPKLSNSERYQILCVYPTDADTNSRVYSGCSSMPLQKVKRLEWFSEYKKVLDSSKFIQKSSDGYVNPYALGNFKGEIASSFQDGFNNGCKRAGVDSFNDYLKNYISINRGHTIRWLSCSFGSDKKYFSLMLEATKYLAKHSDELDWNEVVVREWSYLSDQSAPVEAIYYLYAEKNINYKNLNKISSDTKMSVVSKSIILAKEWQKSIYKESGRVVPILRLNTDAFIKGSKGQLLTYNKEDNTHYLN